MKKTVFLLVILFHITSGLHAQTNQSMPMPDVNRLMSMTPAERERYADSIQTAQAKYTATMASAGNYAIDEVMLPSLEIKPPVKDIARLALIPTSIPTRNELLAQVRKSEAQLKSVMPAQEVIKIETFSYQKSADIMHQAAIGSFYNNEPEKALLLMMKAAQSQPDSLILWNNLGALFNQVGLPHRAVAMLKYCDKLEPGSSIILNNIAQSFMGLGDIIRAKQYFVQCLAQDSLNPDANHSMGLIAMFNNNLDEAMRCFNRELSVAMRSSTMALAARTGKKINLRALMNNKNALNGRANNKDFFEEIALGKFLIPTFPKTVIEAYAQVSEYEEFSTSVQAEAQFWLSVGLPSSAQTEMEGASRPGLYASLVEALLEELHEEFTPEYLSNITDNDGETALEIIDTYEKALAAIDCPKPPAGSSIDAQIAFDIKCCTSLQQPIRNNRLAEYGGFWRPKVDVARQRWKSYLNQLIAVVQLDPSSGNQLMVYRAVSAYFSFLGSTLLYSGTGEAVNKSLRLCNQKFTVTQADSVITADHNWRLACPAWLNIEVDVEVAKIKADCSKYGIEAGSSIIGQYEYDFKTGGSTLAAGSGMKAKFLGGLGKASVKRLAFVTFDKNNQIADYGVRGKAEAAIGTSPISIGPVKATTTLIGIEGNWQLGMNSGFTSSVKGKGVLADFIKIDKSL